MAIISGILVAESAERRSESSISLNRHPIGLSKRLATDSAAAPWPGRERPQTGTPEGLASGGADVAQKHLHLRVKNAAVLPKLGGGGEH